MNKSFELGLFCGRFQHIHKGHQNIIDIGLQLCNKLLILVGSAQEKGTKRNPLFVDTRINLIKNIYNEQYNNG
ncbi:MAG: adenylyltransferase/cytidyltransferase family protein [archaeon]